MQLFEKVLQNLHSGVLILDNNLTISFANHWLEDALQGKKIALKGYSFLDYFPHLKDSRLHTAINDSLKNNLPSLLSPGLNRYPFPLYQGGNSRKPMDQLIRVSPIINADQTYCMIEISDVSAMVQRELVLNAMTKKFSGLALTDELTNVANRRQFNIMLDQEIHYASRDGKPLSLIFLDIDSFKPYNDTLGHQSGDLCLIQVINALRKRLRRGGDQLARYGGDEFCIILPNTSIQSAVDTAESLRILIQELAIPHPQSDAAECVTISIGVASWDRANLESSSSLVLRADSSLYRAKQAGRNRVIGHDSDTWIKPSPAQK
ncbi:diguanylate cyclase [Neptunomonas sp.]|uniref:diguanylate cyclase n=2 Tax=Neptunomonas sp. TaxID=1971898 RepID=UPI00356699C2